MARPIEATPVLRGKAAVEFILATQNPRPYTPISFDTKAMHDFVLTMKKKRETKQS
jgi:hypothetical protein